MDNQVYTFTLQFSGQDQISYLNKKCIINLPYQINSLPTKIYSIAAVSGNFLIEDQSFTPFYKLEIENVEDDFCPSHEKRIVLHIPNRKEQNKDSSYFESGELNYYRIRTSDFSHITLRILNAQNEAVNLSKERASFIVINIKIMNPEDVNEYHVKVSGNPHNIAYIDGLLSQFPYYINLAENGTWRMALSSIFLPNPKLENQQVWIHVKYRDQEVTSHFNILEYLSPTFDRYEELNDLKSKDIIQKFCDVFAECGVHSSDVKIEELNKKLTIKSWVNFQFSMSKNLAYVLGDTENGYLKAGGPYILPPYQMARFPSPISMKRRPLDSVFLKCDILQHTIVNDRFKKILRIVPIDNAENSYIHFEPRNLEFHDITPSAMKSLLFKVHNEYDETIKINKDKSIYLNVIIKHFKN